MIEKIGMKTKMDEERMKGFAAHTEGVICSPYAHVLSTHLLRLNETPRMAAGACMIQR